MAGKFDDEEESFCFERDVVLGTERAQDVEEELLLQSASEETRAEARTKECSGRHDER